MVTHGEWSSTDERISKCEGLKILEKAWDGSLPSGGGLLLQLQSACPLCRFFEDVMGAPAIPHILIYRFNRPRDLKSIRGAFYMEIFLGGYGYITKFVLRLPSPDEVEGDSLPTSWDHFYTQYETGKHFPYRCVQKDSVDMNLAKMWVTGCQAKHVNHCADPGPNIMSNIRSLPGFQLIDCTTRKISMPPKGFQYVALSYVWGQTQADVGQASLYTQLDEFLPLDLPQTIQDAIIVTLKLGYQYLWIDKYCINQALDPGGLQEQLAGMGAIYNGAVFTIIAAAGIDAHYGLPGIGNRPRVEQPSIAIDGVTWVSGSFRPSEPIDRSTWATRGWTYQEAHFSRRRLKFTDEQMLFECDTCRRNESMLIGMGEEQDHSSHVLGLWRGGSQSAVKLGSHIELYSRRTLTYPSDILNALDGLFSSIAQVSKQFWGIPINAAGYDLCLLKDEELSLLTLHDILAYGLTWRKDGSMPAKRRAGFPSWSWSGWINPIQWDRSYYLGIVPRIPVHFALMKLDGTSTELTEELIDELSTNSADNILVYTSPLVLRIEAEILKVGFTRKVLEEGYPQWVVVHTRARDQREMRWFLSSIYEVEEDDELAEAFSTQTFDCVILTRNYGLVVRKVNGTAEKIGTLDLRSLWDGGDHLRDYTFGERRSIVVG